MIADFIMERQKMMRMKTLSEGALCARLPRAS
jgi:hypothetical protein